MLRHSLACLAVIFPLLGGVGITPGAEPDSDLASAEKTLREAHIGTDGPSLLDFFRKRTLGAKEQARLTALVRQLGDPSFKKRAQASRELRRAGRSALSFLQRAEKDADLEIANRVRRCLQVITRGPDLVLLPAAARVLAARKPAGAARVLLAYLPVENDEDVIDAIVAALAEVGLPGGKVDPALTAALAAGDPTARAAAGAVLARVPDQRPTVRRLLADADIQVRFQVARALFNVGDKPAVATLIPLLADGPESLAVQSEYLLCQLLGYKDPPAALDLRSAAARRKCVQAWQEWWKANEARIDPGRFKEASAILGLTVICEAHLPNGRGRVYGCARDSKPRWQFALHNPIDAQVLPGRRLLIANCNSNQVVETDRQGKVLWSHHVNLPVSCQRLPNGNTFIGTYSSLQEITREGKTVFSYTRPRTIFCATKLRNGHIVYVHSSHKIIELDAAGKEIRSIRVAGTVSWGGVEPQPDGNYLAALCDRNKVVEIDKTGKILWEYEINTPSLATRLPNGHLLISSIQGRKCVEVDRAGKIHWEHKVQGRLFRVRRY
jgi:HEAT repeat protein